ncbi:MAG TPA: dTDP-4-dehydrorhamnose 3,5-epimerase family protein [Egibacteraceae bacterium]|nr:dTDP-4-dehydrorhamnose 3,5-epimerase family protein [Egibacteraceae bacterium]
MSAERTVIDGLVVVRWPTHGDERGFFRQTYQVREIAEVLGREPVLRQGNHSHSAPGVLRGFHAEPWDKLVYVVRGYALAAIADIRPDSPTFGEALTFRLGEPPDGERLRLFIAEGLANSFLTMGTEPVDYLYDVSDYWRPDIDKPAVAWDDPDLGVPWPLTDPVLSDADRQNPSLRELFPEHPRWAVGARHSRRKPIFRVT